jgi:hypothetical protein
MRVTVLARKGRSVLVEWTDADIGVQRSYVPYDSVVDKEGVTFCELAELGIPFGVPWELLAQQLPPIDGTALQKELRRVGIWTREDLKANPSAALSAIQQVVSLSVQHLLRQADTYLQGVEHE